MYPLRGNGLDKKVYIIDYQFDDSLELILYNNYLNCEICLCKKCRLNKVIYICIKYYFWFVYMYTYICIYKFELSYFTFIIFYKSKKKQMSTQQTARQQGRFQTELSTATTNSICETNEKRASPRLVTHCVRNSKIY